MKNYIEMMLKNNGLRIGDKFNIIDSGYALCNPYHIELIDNDYMLYDEEGNKEYEYLLVELMACRSRIARLDNREKWVPNQGARYYFVTSYGDVESLCNCGDNNDLRIFKRGSYFKTEKEAKECRGVMNFITDIAYPFSIEEWENGDVDKWYIEYDCTLRKAYPCRASNHKIAGLYFRNKKQCENVIRQIGDDKLRKYYFEMED